MGTSTERLRFRSEDAQRVLLVKALEAADTRGIVLTREDRQSATRAARAAVGASAAKRPARWLSARARILIDQLEGEATDGDWRPGALLRLTDPGRGWLGVAIVIGLVAGLATNALGPSRQVHILALPLLGVLIWNLVSMLFLVLRRVLPRLLPAGESKRPTLVARVQGWIQRVAQRRFGTTSRATLTSENESDPPEETRESVRQRGLERYLARWLPVSTPLVSARLERALHAGALSLAVGVIAGMYFRGLAFDYRAGWESTFLGPATVERLVEIVLGPASRLSGIAIPDVESLRQAVPAGAGGGLGSAAPWIHLWAITTGLVVGIPRMLFFLLSSFQASRRSRRLPLDVPATYLRRLLSAVDPASRRVDVIIYSLRLPSSAERALETALRDVFGDRADVHLRPLAYGDEVGSEDALLARGADARCRWVIFNLGQTPEAEVHGALVEALAGATVSGQSLIVAVDEGAYRERLGAGSQQRVDDRLRAWERILAGAATRGTGDDGEWSGALLRLDLSSATAIDPARLFAAAWPSGALDDLRSRS